MPVQTPTLLAQILPVPKCGDLQRQLRTFLFFSGNNREEQPRLYRSHLLSVVWGREIKLLDQCHNESVHLDNAAQFVFIFVQHCATKPSLETYLNLHPMQPLGPPENVALYQAISTHGAGSRRRSTLLTGCRRSRREIHAFPSPPAIFPVGIHKRLAPICPCSFRVMVLASTLRYPRVCEPRKQTYMLYPIRETAVIVPTGTGNWS